MKKNEVVGKLFGLLMVGSLITITSCKDSDDTPVPVADFTFEVNELSVDFDNTSANADSYVWDFGDGETSTETSPSHVYADYGTYTVTLEATGSGGTSSASNDVDLISTEPVTIDGSFEDWADVETLYSYPDGEGRTLLEAKVTDSENFLYFYIRGTASLGEVLQLYIDSDNDGTTGWDYWNWFETPGIEYLMESVIVGWDGTEPSSVLKTATGSDSNWPWEDFIAQQAIFASSDYVTSGSDKVIEFALLKDMFTKPSMGNEIRIVICNSDNAWANVGSLPPKETETAPANYTMKN